jgi:hypothetical protein
VGEKLARQIEVSLGLSKYGIDNHGEAERDSIPVITTAPSDRAPTPPTEPSKLSSIQVATCDTLVTLIESLKLTDGACLKLLQSWQGAVEELEAEKVP